jgi:hypothetical protein
MPSLGSITSDHPPAGVVVALVTGSVVLDRSGGVVVEAGGDDDDPEVCGLCGVDVVTLALHEVATSTTPTASMNQ